MRTIDADVLKGDPELRFFGREYMDALLRIIDRQPTIELNRDR